MTERRDDLSTVQRALAEVRSARARVAAAEAERHEPIAVIGLGCRFPGGASDPESLWTLLKEGVDAISETPADRWSNEAFFDPDPSTPGKITTRAGGFVAGVDQFDHAFFGVSPREAASMDPQQRLVLEVAWEALEHAGQAPDGLIGQPVGIFVGAGATDYFQLLLRRADPTAIDAYMATGGALSVIAGRLAYVLGTQGPAVVVDTACSSSLVAVHHACRSLRQRESRLAIAAGVGVILLPDLSINFSQARMLSPDGRCKTFDASADGYGRGEGCGVVILKRLSDAQADGERILALVRGSAVNQDGRSSGLTVPNGVAQEAVIAAALADARVDAADIDYVEAHGTGTSLGDPIELLALTRSLGRARSADAPILVGSIKTNIGHLEAAAGIAGLIKTVLCLERETLPASLHFRTPNPHVDWPDLPLQVVDHLQAWPDRGRPRRAGVSSFGFSGTNAHVILESAPTEASPHATPDTTPQLLVLSARTAAALRAQCDRYIAHLANRTSHELLALCRTAAVGRKHFDERVFVIGTTVDEIKTTLRDARELVVEHATDTRPRVAFAFSGQGSSFGSAGRELYEYRVFRDALERCCGLLGPDIGAAVRRVVLGEATGDAGGDAAHLQPALFVFQFALAELWQSWNVRPEAVIGHSLGEYAAACVAGALSLEDALRLVAARGRLTQSLPRTGTMAAVLASEESVRLVLEREAPSVSIAVLNAPDSIVISGESRHVQRAREALAGRGIESRGLDVAHAFHSDQVEPILDALEGEAAAVAAQAPRVTWLSTVLGRPFAEHEAPSARYWRQHARDAVRFQHAVQQLESHGCTHVIEFGPHATLCGLGRRNESRLTWLPSAGAVESRRQILSSLGRLYVDRARIDWRAVFDGARCRPVSLPTYPFERTRHWIEAPTIGFPVAERSSEARWRAFADAAARQAASAPFDLRLSSFEAKWSALGELSLATIESTLSRLGAFVSRGETRTLDGVVTVCRIQPGFRPLVARWLAHLVAVHRLEARDETYIGRVPLAADVPPDLRARALAELADYPELIAYFESCAGRLEHVLTGRASPLDTLFPDGSVAIADGLYARSPVARYFNAVIASIVAAVAGAQPPDRRLRVLEIGAGTGGTTASVLPALDPERTEYVFTDVGPTFLARAAERFAASPFVICDSFDVESATAVEHLGPATFDLVIASNVLHATRDLSVTMSHVLRLLKPSGVLIALETTDHPIWLDMTTGLIAGWQRFDDNWRVGHPLLSVGRWMELLGKAGFARADAWPSADSPAAVLGQHVLLAQAPGIEPAGIDAPRVTPREHAPTTALADRGAIHELSMYPPSERRRRLVDVVRAEVTRVLRLAADQAPTARQRLMELGIDSLMAVELRDRLRTTLGIEQPLTATLVFDYPTISAIAGYLETLLPSATATVVNTAGEDSGLDLLDEAAVADMVDARLRDLGM